MLSYVKENFGYVQRVETSDSRSRNPEYTKLLITLQYL